MPRSASPVAVLCSDECSIPAPAPCASTRRARAPCGRPNKADTVLPESNPMVLRSIDTGVGEGVLKYCDHAAASKRK